VRRQYLVEDKTSTNINNNSNSGSISNCINISSSLFSCLLMIVVVCLVVYY